MVQGLIHDVPTCEELIARIMREADEIIAVRLSGLSDKPGSALAA